MSSNNLYDTLMQMARMENIQFSQTQSSRHSQVQTLSEFAKKMKDIRLKIEQVRRNNLNILQMKGRLASNAVPAKQSEMLEETRLLCDKNYILIVSIKEQLENLTNIVKNTQKESPDEPETRAQIYQKQYMVQQVNSMIAETQNVQILIQKFSINTSLKRIKALDPNLSDDQAEKIAKKKDGFEQLVMKTTLGSASLKLKYRLEDITQKNEQVKRLEASVQQNLQLMEQIQYLVKQQGEMIDNIHDNILEAKDYIQKAEQVLHKEKKNHKKSRKKLCCIILIGIIILSLIVVPIVLTIVNKNKSQAATTSSANLGPSESVTWDGEISQDKREPRGTD